MGGVKRRCRELLLVILAMFRFPRQFDLSDVVARAGRTAELEYIDSVQSLAPSSDEPLPANTPTNECSCFFVLFFFLRGEAFISVARGFKTFDLVPRSLSSPLYVLLEDL